MEQLLTSILSGFVNYTSDIDIKIDNVGKLKKIKLKVSKNDVGMVIGRDGKIAMRYVT